MPHLTTDLLRQLLDDLPRGSQNDLAKHMDLEPDKVSRMKNGGRRIQSSEIPLIVEFFVMKGVWPSDEVAGVEGTSDESAIDAWSTVPVLPPPASQGLVTLEFSMPESRQIAQADGWYGPELERGDYAVIEPGEPIRDGDLVFAWRHDNEAYAGRVLVAGDEELEVTTCGDAQRAKWVRAEFLRFDPVTWTGRTLFPFEAGFGVRPRLTSQDAAREFIRNVKAEAEHEGKKIGPLELVERALKHIRDLEGAKFD